MNIGQTKLAIKNSQKKHCVISICVGLLALSSLSAQADSYQENVLFSPSEYQLKAEAKGRIMIYDQLYNKTVELALNTQFDRIENMMFVRTQHVLEDGSIEEEDDCD